MNEKGQSMVEFIFIIPLFFLSMSGMILIFQQQIRSFSDERAQTALSISDAHFEKEERVTAQWTDANESSKNILTMVAEKSLNASSSFQKTVNMQDGVFYEKLHVQNSALCNETQPSYQVNNQKNGKFNFTTCAGKNAYERPDSGFTDKFSVPRQNLNGISLFYPSKDFAWPARKYEVAKDVKLLSLTNPRFSVNQASLSMPDKGFFNAQCFMEPFAPQCEILPVAGKFTRAAIDSSKIQITACLLEGSVKCTGSGPLIAACVTANVAELVLTLKAGKPSPLCPQLTSSLKTTQKTTLGTVNAYGVWTAGKEGFWRRELLLR